MIRLQYFAVNRVALTGVKENGTIDRKRPRGDIRTAARCGAKLTTCPVKQHSQFHGFGTQVA